MRKRNRYEALWCSDLGWWVQRGSYPCKCHRWKSITAKKYEELRAEKGMRYRVRRDGHETTRRNAILIS